ncbi:hypothetical protein JCM33374_g4249 [Metschnikowia sp. JCM 33374]|nr:hypothetical protein JCM33374_g4249 [Metschnikowia sp. JCM 33374]
MDPSLSPEKASSPEESDPGARQSPESIAPAQTNEQPVPIPNSVPTPEHAKTLETEPYLAPLGQNSDAIEPTDNDQINHQIDAATADPIPEIVVDDLPAAQEGSNEGADEHYEQHAEANSSVSNIPPASLRSFTTPSKSLPPLKDIEHITTPKSFGVAKDNTQSGATFKSSPVQTHSTMHLGNLAEVEEDAFDATANDTFGNAVVPHQNTANVSASKYAEVEAAAAFLDVEPQALLSGANDFITKIAHRAQKFSGLQSELSFFKLNQEQINQVQQKKYEQLHKKLEKLVNTNKSLSFENESISSDLVKKEETVAGLRTDNSALLEKVQELENSIHESKNGSAIKQHEEARLNETITSLTRTNAEQGQKISELTKELNDCTNENFSFKLELSKVTNELSYTKNQKDWYESQLKGAQDKYTDLIKRHDSESLKDSNKISSLITQNETLVSLKDGLQIQVKELQDKFERESTLRSNLESKLEVSNSRFAKESDLKRETIELLNIQLQEKNDRISQLESYADDLKASTANSVESLQRELLDKEDKVAQVEERLRRAEDALDSELHKETKLPKLASSAELILQESGEGMSLSTLYAEFNNIKKKLILEKAQKEKLAVQLKHFVAELDSKKPAIANYRSQVQYYEETLKDVLAKSESIRLEKIDREKECIRLRNRLASHEIEISSIKQLSKDLGRQLCFYLIHSKIREGNEDPLSSHEKKVIDQILAKSGNKDVCDESDTDQLITERLICFASIIDLQKKNEELIIAVRSLGKQLEEKDTEPNGFEAAAVEEAKEAILTLQSELESITIKYDAVTKERDLIKSLDGGPVSLDDNKIDSRVLKDANVGLKNKLQENEKLLQTMKSQSETKIRALNDSLVESRMMIEDLKSKLTGANHSVELSESRLENSKKLLENARKEIEHSQKETIFWKGQASKQEDLLVKKSNELRDVERNLQCTMIIQSNLQTEKEVWTSLHASLSDEIQHLKSDKKQLNSFVFNLQSLLKERELSSADLSKKLTQSVENYQALQEKINEKEDRISVLSSQSDMALRAQNAKLEQVNELSQKLLEARSKVAEKEADIDKLKNQLATSGHKRSSVHTASLVPAQSSTEDDSPILASEYNDLKEALKVSEAQVSEYSLIAKSAEDALSKATKSYDEFREASSVKISVMENEKSNLLRELELQKQQVEDLQNKLHLHGLETSSQIQSLQMKLQENSLKVDSFDDMKTDFEKKLSSLGQDLKNQISIADEVQKRYEAKASEAESLNLQLAEQKQLISEHDSQLEKMSSKLKWTEAELKTKEDRLSELLSGQQEELQSAHIKLRDLQYQYDLALTQIELQKPLAESEDPQSSDNFRQVISYLRAEKDSAESKAIIASDEVARLKVQLENVTTELKASKSQMARLQSIKLELEDTNKDHARLMEQLEQLNILRESNTTLRIENRSCLEKIEELESKVESLSKIGSGDKATDVPVNAQAEVQAQELKLLREENERLKNQPNYADDLDNLRQRFERVKGEFQTKLSNHRSKNKDLERQLNEIKGQLETTSKELSKLKSNHEKNDKTSSLTAQLKKSEADKADVEKKFTDEITALKNDYEKQKAEANSEFAAKLAEATSNAPASAGSSEVQVKERLEAEWKQKLEKATSDLKVKFEKDLSKAVEQRVQERLSKMKKDDPKKNLNEVQDRLKKEYEAKINALKQGLEKKLDDQKTSTDALVTKYEFKLKVLNRKLEKFEKEGESTPSRTLSDEKQKKSPNNSAQPSSGTPDQRQLSQQSNESTLQGTQFNNGESPVAQAPGQPANDEGSEGNLAKKRPFSQGNPPSINFKRPKE